MIFKNLQRFNDTLTGMIIVFNKCLGTVSDFIISNNRNGGSDAENSALS
jgi:hypothetical protein